MVRTIGFLLAIALVPAALSGCGADRPVEAKTDAVARALEGMPGVLAVSAEVHEQSLSRGRYSSLGVELDRAVSPGQVRDVIDAFTDENLRTGVDGVSSILNLRIDVGSPLDTEYLVLDYPHASPHQLERLTRAWFELRERFTGVSVELMRGGVTHPGAVFEVSIGMPEGSTELDGLEAIRLVGSLLDDAGTVRKIFPVRGHFEVVGGLPGEATLRLVQSIIEHEGVLASRGSFWGDDLVRLEATISGESALVDLGIGVPRVMAGVVDLIPQDSPAMRLDFVVRDSDRAGASFDNETCDRFGEGPSAALSGTLMSYWARDGRTLRDGSPADCG